LDAFLLGKEMSPSGPTVGLFLSKVYTDGERNCTKHKRKNGCAFVEIPPILEKSWEFLGFTGIIYAPQPIVM
jgi:hypothetical protein